MFGCMHIYRGRSDNHRNSGETSVYTLGGLQVVKKWLYRPFLIRNANCSYLSSRYNHEVFFLLFPEGLYLGDQFCALDTVWFNINVTFGSCDMYGSLKRPLTKGFVFYDPYKKCNLNLISRKM